MQNHHPVIQSFSLSSHTSNSISSHITKSPVLIIPLGTMEPYGFLGDFGINSFCINAIAETLSMRLAVLSAPVLNYGCSGRYKSFPGAIGVKPKIFSSMLNSICNDCFFQGFTRIILLNSSEENDLALELLTKRYNNQSGKIDIFSLQSDKRVREFVRKKSDGFELGRSEYMMLSMAAYLKPEYVRHGDQGAVQLPALAAYTAWKKRGRDPEKFRKLFPSSISSDCAQAFDPVFGKELFDFVVTVLCDQFSTLSDLNNGNAAS